MIESLNMSKPISLNGRNLIDRKVREQFKLGELGIFMSYACNLSCEYCPHMSSYKKDQSKHLDLNLLKEKLPLFIDKYYDPQIPIGISVSGGEPLLNWNKFVELTSILNKISVPIKGKQITTNLLTDLDVNKLKFLVDNYNNIHLSIDGNYNTQELRKQNSFNKIMKNIITLLSINSSIEYPANITASITITEKNVKYLYENIEFFMKNGIGITGGLDTTSQLLDKTMTKERLEMFAKTFFEQVALTRRDFNWPMFSLKELILQCDREQSYYTANILPDGNIYRCPISPTNPISSLIGEMNINYDHLESFTEIGLKYDDHCNGCELRGKCGYCYAATGSNRDFYCGMLRAINKLDEKYMKGAY